MELKHKRQNEDTSGVHRNAKMISTDLKIMEPIHQTPIPSSPHGEAALISAHLVRLCTNSTALGSGLFLEGYL